MALFGIPKDLKDLMNSKKPGVALALHQIFEIFLQLAP